MTTPFGDQLESQTAPYLERLTDCVSLLPVVLEEYAARDAYLETVEDIQTLESKCDEMIRSLTGLITNAGPEDMGLLDTRIDFNEAALLALYKDIDVVANLTERIVQELVMMQPPHENDCFRGLQAMATEIVSMTITLEDVVTRFVTAICNTYESDTLIDEIEDIRARESRCDELRNDVITTAFSDDEIESPLLWREFAILFDDLANKIEDITDQIIIIASNEPGIVTEADPNGE